MQNTTIPVVYRATGASLQALYCDLVDTYLQQAETAISNCKTFATDGHRYGKAPFAPTYAQQQSKLDLQPLPHIEVPTLFACGLADAVNLPASSEGQDEWFPRGYERIELPGVGHFPQREVPASIAQLIRRVGS
jgi:pimeloyl-ACP methyl ester carboxylesterase